jgi:enoyl-CoA hydratase/carnithine racemase
MKNGASSGVMLFIALMKVFGRLLRLGVPTIAAINGHVVAGGLIMALACDYRIMSKDAGSAKMTEINLGMSLPRGGNGIFNVKVTPDVHRDFILRGKVFTPQECFDRKVVDFLVPADEVYKKAVELAKEVMQFGEKKMVYAMIKTSMYFDQIKISEEAVYRQGELDCITTPKI